MALFLASYIVVMLLPLSIGLGYYYPNMRKMLIEHATERSGHTVAQLAQAMDAQLANVYGMPGHITANRQIIEYEMRTNPLARRTAQDQLNQLIRTNTFIERMYLYLRSMEYMIGAPAGAFYFSELSEHPSLYQTSFGDVSNAALGTLLQTADQPIVMPSRNVMLSGVRHGKMLLFILPVPQGQYAYGAVLICVSDAELNALVNADGALPDSRVLYYGGNGALLHTNAPVNTAEVLDINAALADTSAASGTMYADVQGSRQLLSWATSPLYGWRYVNAVPVRAITQEADRLQRVSMLITLAIMLVSAACIYVAMRVNYLPIHKLARQVTDMSVLPSGRRDDFGAIQHLIQSLRTHNAHLDERISQSTPHLREYLAGQAIHGEIRDMNSFLRQCAQVGLEIGRSPYAVLIASYVEPGAAQDAIARLSEADTGGEAEVIAVEGDQPTRVDIILCGTVDGTAWQTVLAEIGGYHMLAVGTRAESLGVLSDSYRHADAALDYLALNNLAGQMMRYDDLPERVFKPRGYPTDVMQSLEMSIQHGDFQRMRQLVAQIASMLTLEGAPPYFTRSVYFNATNLLIAGLHRWFGNENEIVHEIGIRSMLSHYNVSEMVGILDNTAEQLYLLMQRHSQAQSPMADVVGYIDQHLDSPLLSLQSVADAFDLSASAMSRLFKEKTGRNFKEYIDSARLAVAKKMLEESDLPVEQIASAVGYDNLPSFYRLFKKNVGIAPGEYRQARRRKK